MIGLITCFRHGYSNKHKSYNEGEYETFPNIFYPRENGHQKKNKNSSISQESYDKK
jgi:hypothetical protein